MNIHKNDLSSVSTRALLARRRSAGGRLGDVEEVLVGSLSRTDPPVRAGGVPVRRAANRTARTCISRRNRPVGVGHGMCRRGWWRRCGRWLARGEQVAAVIAEISAINAELLARRELR